MKLRDIVIVAVLAVLSVLCLIRGGETAMLGAWFAGMVAGRMLPVIFP